MAFGDSYSVTHDHTLTVAASGVLELQACDDRQCFPPKSIPLTWKFKFIAPDRQRSPVDLRREFEP